MFLPKLWNFPHYGHTARRPPILAAAVVQFAVHCKNLRRMHTGAISGQEMRFQVGVSGGVVKSMTQRKACLRKKNISAHSTSIRGISTFGLKDTIKRNPQSWCKQCN
jgi:hypothetical protein